MRLGMLLATFAASVAVAAPAQAGTPRYRVAASIAGPDGGWDYARVDAATRRLYVARSNAVTVVDLATAAPVRSIGDIARGHAAVPFDRGKLLLVTSGNDATVRILEVASGAELHRIPVGKKADAAILDAAGRTAYVMNAEGGTISVIDLASARVTRTIAVKPALEYAAFGKDGTLFVNDEDANEIEPVSVRTGEVEAPIALGACKGPTGLAYDAPHDRLIAACANGKAAIVNAATRRLTGLVETGSGADAVIIDGARHLAFIPCGRDGVLDILSLAGPKVARVGRVETEKGARTGALDPKTGVIYLPTAKYQPAAQPGARPSTVPGSFHIVVVRPA